MQRYNYFLIKILSSGKIIKTIVYYPIVETGRAPSLLLGISFNLCWRNIS